MQALAVLTQEELEAVLEMALRLLEQIGFQYKWPWAIEAMAQAGVQIEAETMTAHLPAELVRQALTQTKEWSKALLRDEPTLVVGRAPAILELGTTKKRAASPEDLLPILRLINELPYIWASNTGVSLPNAEADAGELAGMEILFRYSRKKILTDQATPEVARAILEMAGIAYPLKENRPLIYRALLAKSLQLSRAELETLQLYGEERQTIFLQPADLPEHGALSPAGVLALTMANCLGTMVYLYAIHSQSPVVCCTPSAFARAGATYSPSLTVLQLGFSQLARYLDCAVATSAGRSNSFAMDFQGGWEGGISGMLAWLAGTEILDGRGLLGNGEVFSPAQLLIENETAGALHALGRDCLTQKGNGQAAAETSSSPQPSESWASELFPVEAQDIRLKRRKTLDQRIQDRLQRIWQSGPPDSLLNEAQVQELNRISNCCTTQRPRP